MKTHIVFEPFGENKFGIPEDWPRDAHAVSADAIVPDGWIGPVLHADFRAHMASRRAAYEAGDKQREKADRAARLRDQAWSTVDMREALANLAVVVGLLASKLPEEDKAALAPALSYCNSVTDLLAGWSNLEAVLESARTFEEIQAVKPDFPDLTPPRASDVARAVRGNK